MIIIVKKISTITLTSLKYCILEKKQNTCNYKVLKLRETIVDPFSYYLTRRNNYLNWKSFNISHLSLLISYHDS